MGLYVTDRVCVCTFRAPVTPEIKYRLWQPALASSPLHLWPALHYRGRYMAADLPDSARSHAIVRSGASPLRGILLIVVLLIVYGCLYPFSFHAPPAHGWTIFLHNWPAELSRFVVRDALVNLLLYVPLGVSAFIVFAPGPWSPALPLILASLLSFALELLQLFVAGRTSSIFDVACNVAGAVVGVAVGRLYSDDLFRALKRTGYGLRRAPAQPMLLLGLWAGYDLFPLFPVVGTYAIRQKLGTVIATPFSAVVAVHGFIEWIAVCALVEAVAGARYVRVWTFALLLLVPARLLLFRRTFVPAELAGALSAWIAWNCILARVPRRFLIVGCVFCAGLLLEGLAPYRWSAVSQSFSWIPFSGFLNADWDLSGLTFFRKSFGYGFTIWAFYAAGYGFLRPAAGVMLLLAAIEWAQRYLPGRTPEVSDPLLALLLAAIMALAEVHRNRVKVP